MWLSAKTVKYQVHFFGTVWLGRFHDRMPARLKHSLFAFYDKQKTRRPYFTNRETYPINDTFCFCIWWTGQITLKAPLSFGDRNLYNLKVKAEDGATPPRSGESNVIITVQDTNDFRPVFNPTTYSKRIAENTPRGSNVVRVTATDRDTGPSGQLSYHIESGNVKNAFLINSQTGRTYLVIFWRFLPTS